MDQINTLSMYKACCLYYFQMKWANSQMGNVSGCRNKSCCRITSQQCSRMLTCMLLHTHGKTAVKWFQTCNTFWMQRLWKCVSMAWILSISAWTHIPSQKWRPIGSFLNVAVSIIMRVNNGFREVGLFHSSLTLFFIFLVIIPNEAEQAPRQ